MASRQKFAGTISDDVFQTLYGTTDEEEMKSRSSGSAIQLGLNYVLETGEIFTVALGLPLMPIICDKREFTDLVNRIGERVSEEIGEPCHKASMEELEAFVKKQQDAEMLEMLEKVPASSLGQA